MKTLIVVLVMLIAPEVYAAQVPLTWTDPKIDPAVNDPEEGFNIQRNLNGGAYSNIAAVAANVTTYVDATIVSPPPVTAPTQPGKNTYCYQVISWNKNPPKTGTLQASAPSNITCVDVLGIQNPAPVKPPAAVTDLTATLDTSTRAAPVQRKK